MKKNKKRKKGETRGDCLFTFYIKAGTIEIPAIEE